MNTYRDRDRQKERYTRTGITIRHTATEIQIYYTYREKHGRDTV